MNEVPVEGATNFNLRLPVVTAALEGWYTLAATNPMGSVTSRPVAALVSNVDPHVLAVLAWPGDPVNPITLQASESVTGPWIDRQDYPAAEGVQGYVEPDGTAAALFYRLKGARPVALAATGRVNGWWFEEAAGSQHRIEYVSATAGWTQWQVLTNLTLPSSPYLFVDHASQAEPGRAYRVTPGP